jgi:cytochrome c-type biogenesis protein CcmH
VARIEAHLAANPDDGRGFEVVAPVYMRLGRYEDAARAYAEVIRLLGETPARHAAHAEALVNLSEGVVTGEARQEFEAALKDAPNLPSALYYLGLAAEQEGDKPQAVEHWTRLLEGAPADAPFAAALRAKIETLRGGEASPADAIAAMPKGDQQAVIRGMVDQLAERLHRDGKDVGGWLRLIRSYKVLNEPEKLKAAVGEARQALAGDPAALQQIDALAGELGFGG